MTMFHVKLGTSWSRRCPGGVDPRTIGTRTNLVPRRAQFRAPGVPVTATVGGAAPRNRCSRSHHDRLEHLHAASEPAAASTDHSHLPVIHIAHGLDDPHARPVDVPQSRTHSDPSLRPVSPNREHRAPRSAPLMTTSAPRAWMACRGWSQPEPPTSGAIPAIRLP